MFVFAQVGGGIVLAAAGDLALAGTISVGTALTVQLLSQRAITPLGAVAPMFQQGLDTRVSFRRLRQPFGVPVLPAVRPDAEVCPRIAGRIAFVGVEFSYPHVGRPVLHDVSLAIDAGSVVALVGYTGAGKSSIAKLIARVYDPDAGAVLVDGRDLRDLDLGSYRRRLGIVPQDAFVFKGTVASNIGYGDEEATPAQIETAAKAVGAHDMLAALPGGYEHPVDEEGRNLTAAQRQLIALARAWLVRPEVLVLDEATSTLDARLERRVLQAVSQLGVTTIMVTHRQENLAFVDEVIVLDGGRVAETGRPGDLIGGGGAYDALWATDPEADLPPDPEADLPPALVGDR
jgi:ATP-binding cassette subfamily B protein